MKGSTPRDEKNVYKSCFVAGTVLFPEDGARSLDVALKNMGDPTHHFNWGVIGNGMSDHVKRTMDGARHVWVAPSNQITDHRLTAEEVNTALKLGEWVGVEHPERSKPWHEDWALSNKWHSVCFNTVNVDGLVLTHHGSKFEIAVRANATEFFRLMRERLGDCRMRRVEVKVDIDLSKWRPTKLSKNIATLCESAILKANHAQESKNFAKSEAQTQVQEAEPGSGDTDSEPDHDSSSTRQGDSGYDILDTYTLENRKGEFKARMEEIKRWPEMHPEEHIQLVPNKEIPFYDGKPTENQLKKNNDKNSSTIGRAAAKADMRWIKDRAQELELKRQRLF